MIKKTAFDRDSFVNGVNYRVDALKSEAEKYLSDTMKSEGKSNVNTDFKETLTQFKSSINISCGGATITKNFFPDEVYKILLASHTVEHKLEIKKIDGTLIKEMQTYISSILGTNNIITTADGKSYKVDTTLASAGLATVTVGGKLYILDWDSNSTAKESLYDLLGSLKTWGENLYTYVFTEMTTPSIETLFSDWTKALITCKLADVTTLYNTLRKFANSYVAEENVSAWKSSSASKWLDNITKKFFPATNKEVTALRKQCQTLDNLAKETALLKGYNISDGENVTAELITNTVTGLAGYKNFVKAYNELQTAIGLTETNEFDSLISDYIGYEISGVASGMFNEDNATIICADGNNELTVSGSKVSVGTGSGDDEIQIGTYSNRNSGVSVDAGTGNDFIYNYGSKVTISGGKGADSIRSEGDKVSISGGAGNDNIEIWKSDVTVDAGAGNDSIYSHGSDYSIFGGAGNDDIIVTDSGSVFGGTGIDTIQIQGSDVIVYGGGAFDSLPTKDVFNIGSGASNVYIFDFESADELNLPSGNYTAQIEFGSTAIRNSSGKLIVWLNGFTEQLENLTYNEDVKKTTDGDDSINNDVSNIKIDLGEGNNYIYNSGKNVTIYGGDGNNTVYSYHSNATVKTGSGDDYVFVYSGGSIDAGDGNDTIYSKSGYSEILGGKGDDLISLSSYWDNNNLILYRAGDGNDTVWNFNGRDTLSIEAGAYSTMTSGNDVIVTVGDDSITLKDAAYIRTLNISRKLLEDVLLTVTNSDQSPVTVNASVETIDATGRTKAIKITGNDLANTIGGGSKNDTLLGAAGNDSICGYGGNDKLYGNDGDDYLSGGAGNDSLAGDAGADKIYGNDSLYGGTGNDSLAGGAGKDSIYGGAGADKLFGNEGADSLWGGTGNDTLYGGDGIDTFIYKLNEGTDTILDYQSGELLQIMNGTFSKTTYSSGTLTLTINSGGSVIFKNVTTSTQFNINGTTYHVNGSTLEKK